MDKTIADEIWAFCKTRQNGYFQLWNATSNQERAEVYRLQCAAWADAQNEIYRLWLQPEPLVKETSIGNK